MHRLALTLIAIAFVSGPLAAQNERPALMAWGTSATSTLVIHAQNFQWYAGGAPTQFNGDRGCETDQCTYLAGFDLPSGSLITGFGLDGCVSTPGLGIQFSLWQRQANGNVVALTTTGNTGSGAPGCSTFIVTPDYELAFDKNLSYLAFVDVSGTTSSSAVRFGAVRVFYKLRVSPAPVTATFADVPATHPFFQFIEALAASGVTAGCGDGNFCPEAPLTRGQMAVFLSRALGLHFPN